MIIDWIEKRPYNVENINISAADSDAELQNLFGREFKWQDIGDVCDLCFHYALQNKKLWCVDQSVGFMEDHYKEIPFKEVRTGDIVLFRNELEYLHFAKVTKKRSNIAETKVIGKFGGWQIYEHKLRHTPDIYGNIISFWRKKGIEDE